MAGRVRVDSQEIGFSEIVMALAGAIEGLGEEVWGNSDPNDAAATMCADEYRKVCREAADGLRKVIARLDRSVLRHLCGTCKAH